ncbi:MAG: hypothetical protein JKY55_00550 [Aliivibrio sp.]|uniref:hypothetical protein n=1 Tax=Aliivibrio sp. TaxID=1872443 RepID=UPI001A39AF2B|nr:hypothetical protein [Aliivibrio sp.]
MAYGLKYYSEYFDDNGNLSRIEIKQRNFVGTAKEVYTTGDGYSLEFPSIDKFYQPVVGGGCELEFESPSDGEFISLYAADPLEFKLLVKKGGLLLWDGYLNTETHGETYTRKKDYPVALTANNGLRILEQIKFLDENKDPYSGTISVWSVVKNITDRIGIEIERINICCDRWPVALSSVSEITPLHVTYIDRANYSDEKGEALNCFEVLEAVLLPLGICLYRDMGNLYLTHFTEFRNDTRTYKSYNSLFSYVESFTINHLLDVSAGDVEFYESDQGITLVPGYNSQKITYKPYSYEEVINPLTLDDQAYWINPGLVWNAVEEDDEIHYKTKNGDGITGWTFGAVAQNVGYKEKLSDDGDFVLSLINQNGELLGFRNEINSVTIGQNNKLKLKLKFQFRILTKETPFSKTTRTNFDPDLIQGYVKIRIGNKILGLRAPGSDYEEWLTEGEDPDHAYYLGYGLGSYIRSDGSLINKWHNIEIDIIEGWPQGAVDVYFHGFFTDGYRSANDPLASDNDKIEYQFKDVKTQVYKIETETLGDGSTVNWERPLEYNDLEYSATLAGEFSKQADGIELIHADSYDNFSFDRGGFLLADGTFTRHWKRPSEMAYLPLVDHLLKDIASCYAKSRISLKGTVSAENMLVKLNQNNPKVLSLNSVILDSGQILGSARFRMIGGTYKDTSQTLSGEWEELKNETIIID